MLSCILIGVAAFSFLFDSKRVYQFLGEWIFKVLFEYFFFISKLECIGFNCYDEFY